MKLKGFAVLGLIVVAVAWHSKKQESANPALSHGGLRQALLPDRLSGQSTKVPVAGGHLRSMKEAT